MAQLKESGGVPPGSSRASTRGTQILAIPRTWKSASPSTWPPTKATESTYPNQARRTKFVSVQSIAGGGGFLSVVGGDSSRLLHRSPFPSSASSASQLGPETGICLRTICHNSLDLNPVPAQTQHLTSRSSSAPQLSLEVRIFLHQVCRIPRGSATGWYRS
jgi:hypothetical protein